MQLGGLHHVTAVTTEASENLAFYTEVLGLRLVKKTVNQDDPSVYHLFYADEHGSAASDITFFEYPGAAPGRPGDGMVHTVGWRVAPDAAPPAAAPAAGDTSAVVCRVSCGEEGGAAGGAPVGGARRRDPQHRQHVR